MYHGPGRAKQWQEGTVGSVFNSSLSDSIKKSLDETLALQEQNPDYDQNLSCRQDMLATDEVIAETMRWELAHKVPKQFLSTDADEEGFFQIKRVPAGQYEIVARGQAGINDGLWQSLDVTVNPGSETSIKLSSPGKTCLAVTQEP
jgi:hypothetical protein